MRSDDERAPHNHPWWFASLVLRGSYIEHRADQVCPIIRRPFSFGFRGLDTFHRVELPDGKPCWTIVVTGPDIRGWGFLCRDIEIQQIGEHEWFERERPRLVPWREFDGCGE
jgi:hypothetical protein